MATSSAKFGKDFKRSNDDNKKSPNRRQRSTRGAAASTSRLQKKAKGVENRAAAHGRSPAPAYVGWDGMGWPSYPVAGRQRAPSCILLPLCCIYETVPFFFFVCLCVCGVVYSSYLITRLTERREADKKRRLDMPCPPPQTQTNAMSPSEVCD